MQQVPALVLPLAHAVPQATAHANAIFRRGMRRSAHAAAKTCAGGVGRTGHHVVPDLLVMLAVGVSIAVRVSVENDRVAAAHRLPKDQCEAVTNGALSAESDPEPVVHANNDPSRPPYARNAMNQIHAIGPPLNGQGSARRKRFAKGAVRTRRAQSVGIGSVMPAPNAMWDVVPTVLANGAGRLRRPATTVLFA